MDEQPPNPFGDLQSLRLRLLHQREHIEALVLPFNAEITKLFQLGLCANLAYLGGVLLTEPYEQDADSGRAYVAVLTTATGFGAIQIDTEDTECLEDLSSDEINRRMTPYRRLTLRCQAAFAKCAHELLNRLLFDLNLCRGSAGPDHNDS